MDVASRLISALARDGTLPFSPWIGRVDENKKPRNALTLVYIFSACLLCAILPSQVAFASLTSAGGVPMAAACGLIPLLTLFATPKSKLGPFAKYCYVAAVVFNAAMLTVKVSPFFFPVTAETFNFVSPSKLN